MTSAKKNYIPYINGQLIIFTLKKNSATKGKLRMRGKYLSLLVLIVLASSEALAMSNSSIPKLRRSDFPEDFIFGSATSAYQVYLFFVSSNYYYSFLQINLITE